MPGQPGQFLGVCHALGVPPQRDAVPPRDDVEVEMKNGLTSLSAVELRDDDPIRGESGDRRSRNPLNSRDDRLEIRRVHIDEISCPSPLVNHQAVAPGLRKGIHEGQRVFVFENSGGGNFAAHNLCENVVWVVWPLENS